MSLKWTSQEIKKFLDLYRKHEVLWNIHRKEYRGRTSREQVWEELLGDIRNAGLLCEDIHDLKNKLRILKTVYMKEVRKISKSRLTATNEDVYKPKLVWFEKANSFLKDVSRLRSIVKKDKETTIYKTETEKVKTPTSSTEDTNATLISHSPRARPNGIRLLKQPIKQPKKFVKSNRGDGILRRVEKILDKEINEDQFEIIGKSVAMKLRVLPKEVQIYTEKFISDVLFEAAIGNINKFSTIHIATQNVECISPTAKFIIPDGSYS